MNYYNFHIGDYISHTIHLSLEEDLAYRRLLDMYYDTELPIPNNIPLVSRKLRINADVVKTVLEEFFDLTEDGFKNFRAENEIAEYRKFIEKQKANGSKGGRPKKSHRKPTANPNQTQNNPNQEPITTNQEPMVKTQRGSRLPTDWTLPDDWADWAEKERPDLLIYKTADSFRDFWISKPGAGGVTLNWEATWSNWVRSQKQSYKPQDVVHQTTPTPANHDAALRKIEEDRKKAVKPNAEVQARIAELLKGRA